MLAALCFVCITLLFVGIGHDWWGWLARLQMLPAVTRLIGSATLGNIAVVLGILLITWLFGRIYCSVLCPLGVFQDIVFWIRRNLGRKVKPLRKRFNFNRERRWVRYPMAALYIASLLGIALRQAFTVNHPVTRDADVLLSLGPYQTIVKIGVPAVLVFRETTKRLALVVGLHRGRGCQYSRSGHQMQIDIALQPDAAAEIRAC